MSNSHIVRAWKDPEYRASLSVYERAALPASPVGVVELSDVDLVDIDGGSGTPTITIVTAAAGCFTFNSTACNGTCAAATQGCCGG